MLDALRKKAGGHRADAILPSDSDHTDRYADAIGDELLAAAVAGAGTTGDASPAALRKSIAKSSTLDPVRVAIAADLVGPLRDRLSRCVADGAGDNDDITKRVRAVYREWKTQHIDDQLDDVFRLAYGAGALAAATPGHAVVLDGRSARSAVSRCRGQRARRTRRRRRRRTRPGTRWHPLMPGAAACSPAVPN